MKLVKVLFILCITFSTGCGPTNVLDEYSNTDSDAAKFFEAKKLLDRSEWAEVIDIIENDISASYAAKAEVKETLASAYSGQCGFTFVDILSGLEDATSSNFFPLFLSIFSSNQIQVASCDQAISILQSIGTVTTRTAKQNLFLSILGMARVGTTLAIRLDADVDGVADAGSKVCENVHATDPHLPAVQIKKIATGIGLIFENISALSGMLDSSSNSLGGMEDALSACTSLGVGVDCVVTNEADVSNELDYVVRSMLDTGDYGFGTCVLGSAVPAEQCCPTITPPFP